MGDAPVLLPMKEEEDFVGGSFGGSSEKYRIEKFGRRFDVSDAAIIEDDLGIILGTMSKWARRAKEKKSELFYNVFCGGKNLSDGPLYSLERGNLIDNKLNVVGAAAAIIAITERKAPDGTSLSITPRYVVVGPRNYLPGKRLLLGITAGKSADVNPFNDGSLQLIMDTRITGLEWYMSADPNVVDTIEMAHLEGQNGLRIKMQNSFDRDALSISAMMRVGVAAIDSIGLVKSTGTGA